MADSVIPRQQGDEYQAMYFWYQACNLFSRDSTAIQIEWERNDVPGFDDVTLHYSPPQIDFYGTEVHNKYFQVKFHVDHQRGFTCEALTDPSFIGNKTESILQRLLKNYKLDKETFSKSQYHIVNTWHFDHTDHLRNLIDSNGAFRLEKLFDGSDKKSKTGKIRIAWSEHLNISEAELKEVLKPLRIIAGAKGLEASYEDINFRFNSIGFKPIPDTRRTSPYATLIQKLHSENRKSFTKEELLEILKTEQLLFDMENQESNVHKIGVRSFKRGTDSLKFETDEYLCLLPYFKGRNILDIELWNATISPLISEFSEKAVEYNKPLQIHLDTHLSIAFALGYFLDNKTGVSTDIWQKGPNGRKLFSYNMESEDYKKSKNNTNWDFEQISNNEEGTDIVISLNITHQGLPKVQEYVINSLPHTSKIISATIIGGPTFESIRDGNHILLSVLELLQYIKANRIEREGKGQVHLFIIGPASFSFVLGQFIKSLGHIKLYEYDFEGNGSYQPTIELPYEKK